MNLVKQDTFLHKFFCFKVSFTNFIEQENGEKHLNQSTALAKRQFQAINTKREGSKQKRSIFYVAIWER
jgi:hypothetical protein